MNKPTVQKSHYAITPSGDSVDEYLLTNKNGMAVSIITFGGIVTKLTAPDRYGKYEDIVLGFDDPQDYFNRGSEYFGAVIGRVANRIANGSFAIDGNQYHVDINNFPNALHGGRDGFNRKIWRAEIDAHVASPTLHLSYRSPHLEEGFPGNLQVKVTYTLREDDALEIAYEAETDQKTVVNLTHHSYFNLSANFHNTVLDHELFLSADAMLPIYRSLIPTGEIRSVASTPFDFRTAKTMGKDLMAPDEQIEIANGYDHSWILNADLGLLAAGTVYHPPTGRLMKIFTDQPAVQFYSGNFLDGSKPCKTGGMYQKNCGFCLETQQFPNAVNQSEFPSIILHPEEIYTAITVYQFAAR